MGILSTYFLEPNAKWWCVARATPTNLTGPILEPRQVPYEGKHPVNTPGPSITLLLPGDCHHFEAHLEMRTRRRKGVPGSVVTLPCVCASLSPEKTDDGNHVYWMPSTFGSPAKLSTFTILLKLFKNSVRWNILCIWNMGRMYLGKGSSVSWSQC